MSQRASEIVTREIDGLRASSVDSLEITGPVEVEVGRTFELTWSASAEVIAGGIPINQATYEINQLGRGTVESGSAVTPVTDSLTREATATGDVTFELVVTDFAGNRRVDTHTVSIVEDTGGGGAGPGNGNGNGDGVEGETILALLALAGLGYGAYRALT